MMCLQFSRSNHIFWNLKTCVWYYALFQLLTKLSYDKKHILVNIEYENKVNMKAIIYYIRLCLVLSLQDLNLFYFLNSVKQELEAFIKKRLEKSIISWNSLAPSSLELLLYLSCICRIWLKSLISSKRDKMNLLIVLMKFHKSFLSTKCRHPYIPIMNFVYWHGWSTFKCI